MAFRQDDIKRFLVDAIPGRFHHLSLQEFESFIAYLFQKDGYEVEEISKKGDHAASLIAKKEGISMVIRVLRFEPDNEVKEHEIQKAVAAKAYYETDQAWVLTTSIFSKEATKAAEAGDVELWDWDALLQAINDLFFEGKSYLDVIDTLPPVHHPVIASPEMKLKAKWKPEEGIGAEWYNLDLIISNPSDKNIYIHLDLPALIDTRKNQITAEKWADHEFVSGMIYAGASVRTNALFNASRLGERPPGGRVMVTCHERSDPPSTYHLSARLKGEACYFVTYCYSRQSPEYIMMIQYRDWVLSKTYAGRLSISIYYLLSPFLVRWALKNKMIDQAIRWFTRFAIKKIIFTRTQ